MSKGAITQAIEKIDQFLNEAGEITVGFIGNDGSFYVCDFDMEDTLKALQDLKARQLEIDYEYQSERELAGKLLKEACDE